MFDQATVDECIRVIESYAKRMRDVAAFARGFNGTDDWFYLETHAFAAEALAMRIKRKVKCTKPGTQSHS